MRHGRPVQAHEDIIKVLMDANQHEIGKILNLSKSTIRDHLKRFKASKYRFRIFHKKNVLSY